MAPGAPHFLPAPEIRKQFAGLSKDDENERIEAAKGLNVLLRNTTENRNETVKYCLTRLIKGLTSGNDSSRLGFSLALVELLYSLLNNEDPLLTDYPFRSIIQLIVEHTEPSGGLSKQEERGFYFGRLFGLKSLIETRLLFTGGADAARWRSVLAQLILLAQKKPWLRESCCLIIRNAILEIDGSQKELIKATCEELEKSGLVKSSDGIGIWITLLQRHQKTLDSMNLRLQNRSSPLENSYLQTLAKILKESEGKDGENEKLAQKGSWNARLSWAWDVILEYYRDSKHVGEGIASFGEFWQAVVNNGLFSNSSSEERKFWGFLIFNRAISTFKDKETIAELFCPNFMTCFINQLGAPKRYLHKAAQKSLQTIKSKAEADPVIASTLLLCLLTGNGSPNFESITKTKIIEPISSCADEQGQLEIILFFKSLILRPDAEDQKSIEKSRQWAADQLLSLIRSSKVGLQSPAISEITNIFVEYGHFNVKSSKEDSPTPEFSPATQAVFRTRLSSCLSELLQRPEFRDVLWPAKAVLLIKEKQASDDTTFAITVDENIKEEISKVFKIVSKLNKKSPATGSRRYAFELMYSLLLLQLFNGEPDAMDMLQDLHLVYEKIGKDSKEKDKKDKHRHKRQKHGHSHDEDEQEEQDSLEILTELLLGFLAKPSVLAKKMSQIVFKSFAGFLSPVALAPLLRPLTVEESQDGQREIFDVEDDDEFMGEDDEDDEEDSDVEVLDVEEEDSEGDSEEDSEEDSGDDSESDVDDEDDDNPLDEETVKLHAALAEALGTSADPAGSDSDSDESMDDDQMLLLDEQLSKIFKQRKAPNKKQERALAKESVVNFKNRILELLEIYVQSDAKTDDKLHVILPCLEALRKTSNQSVRTHIKKVFEAMKKTTKKKQATKDKDEEPGETDTGITDPESAFEILQKIHLEAAQPRQSPEHTASCSSCSLCISKILVTSDGNWRRRIAELYSQMLVAWSTDEKNGTQPAFITDFVTWMGAMRKIPATVVDPSDKVEVTGKSPNGRAEKRKRKAK
ncbi:hypothetical protein TWF696_008913 [Orbilia brochopaga]|uniref:DNA polymerase V n=1 Tax=Orbilia brochopaga TaxID=3140254 RepID=A0AAV9UG06_9PEZI